MRPSSTSWMIAVLLAATVYMIAYGMADWRSCFDGGGLIGLKPAPLLPVTLEPFTSGLALVSGLLLAMGVWIARATGFSVMALGVALAPFLLAVCSMPLFSGLKISQWHHCDRKGCTGCEAATLVLMLVALVAAVLVVVALVIRARRWSQRDRLRRRFS